MSWLRRIFMFIIRKLLQVLTPTAWTFALHRSLLDAGVDPEAVHLLRVYWHRSDSAREQCQRIAQLLHAIAWQDCEHMPCD